MSSNLQKYGISLDAFAIHDKEFKREFRGFDREEVNVYLDQIIKDYSRMQEIINDFERDLAEIHAELERGGEKFDAYLMRRRIEDLEMKVFGERRDRLQPRV